MIFIISRKTVTRVLILVRAHTQVSECVCAVSSIDQLDLSCLKVVIPLTPAYFVSDNFNRGGYEAYILA